MKNKIISVYWFIFLIIYLELIFKIFIFHNIFSIYSINIIFFSIPYALLLYLLCHFFNEKVNHILSTIMSFLLSIWFSAQVIYYDFYDSIFSIFSIGKGPGQIIEFTKAILSVCLKLWYVILLLFLPTIFLIIFGRKFIDFLSFDRNKKLIILGIMIVLFLCSSLAIKLSNKGRYSLNNLYSKTHAPILTVNKMGLITMEQIDIYRSIFGFEEKIELKEKKKVIEEKIEYNTLNINFDELINNESSETIKNMHLYFKGVVPTKKNKYTGLFKNKNLIFITAEAFDTIAIDELLTPTLYKMANNGIIFKNYYQPSFPVSTSDGEYMNMTSLIPKEGVWSAFRSSKISMPFAIGNMFSKLGYKTNAYHNGRYRYYDRNLSHPNMGFNYLACGNGLERRMNCNIWPQSDLDMINVTYQDYINPDTTNFATYYMTISGHLEYNNYGNRMAKKNWDLVKNLPYSYEVKSYLSCHIELDRAMEALLSYLEAAGLLENTLIVIGPDHYPYGLKKQHLNERSSINREDKFELYRTSLIMYSPSIKENIIVDKYVSSIDIVPTVYNLFGLDYDSRLFMGRDVLDDSEGLVILSNRSWISDKGRFDSITRQFIPNEGIDIEEGYVDSINDIVYQKFSMSSLILSNNYYSKLGL